MAWRSVILRTTGEIITASIYNETNFHNMRYLKGQDGVIALEDSITLPAGKLVDGTDISAHVDNADAHQPRSHDHSLAADGTPIAVAGVPNLDVSKITTGRFPMPRMPDGTAGYLLTAQGIGLDPAYILYTGDFAKLKPAVIRWVRPGWYAVSSADATMVAGRIYYIPILVTETTTYIRIGCHVTITVGGSAELRIFNWSDGLPSTQVLAAGIVDTGTTGFKELTISQQLTRNYYFLAIRCTTNLTLRGLNTSAAIAPPVPGFELHAGRAPSCVILTADTFFADPAPSPTGAASSTFAVVELREN